jgi:hypothetical protein
MNRLLRIVVTSLASCFCLAGAWGETAPAAQYQEFFLQAPPGPGQTTIPPDARDIIVAKVCLVTLPFWRGGRHHADPKALLGAELQIVEVLKGKATAGTRLLVSFGTTGTSGQFTFPATPRQRKLDHVVVAYLDRDSERRLIAHPLSQERYDEWDKERWAHERERGRPGAQDERWTSPCPKSS